MDKALEAKHARLIRPIQPPWSAFTAFSHPPEVISIAVHWHLCCGLSHRDLEELLSERDVEVDHVTLFRWVRRFTPLLIDAAWPCRPSVDGRWIVGETYVKVSGTWRYVYRAVAQCGQVIDVFMSKRRDLKAATTFFAMAITSNSEPAEVALLREAAPPEAKHQMRRGPRIEMHCEDLGATELMLSHGAAGCGISVVLPECSSAVGG